MNYNDFMTDVIKKDGRNKFSPYSGDMAFVPEQLKHFFTVSNPIDVEIVKGVNTYVFYPVEKLLRLQRSYSFPSEAFIFATNNSDPVFIMNGCVYTSMAARYLPEKLSDSFEDFLSSLMN